MQRMVIVLMVGTLVLSAMGGCPGTAIDGSRYDMDRLRAACIATGYANSDAEIDTFLAASEVDFAAGYSRESQIGVMMDTCSTLPPGIAWACDQCWLAITDEVWGWR